MGTYTDKYGNVWKGECPNSFYIDGLSINPVPARLMNAMIRLTQSSISKESVSAHLRSYMGSRLVQPTGGRRRTLSNACSQISP